jgi:hypothetical protein
LMEDENSSFHNNRWPTIQNILLWFAGIIVPLAIAYIVAGPDAVG